MAGISAKAAALTRAEAEALIKVLPALPKISQGTWQLDVSTQAQGKMLAGTDVNEDGATFCLGERAHPPPAFQMLLRQKSSAGAGDLVNIC